MIKRVFGTLFAFMLIILTIPFSVKADDFILPGPFYIVSRDETKVFHVIPPLREDLVTWDNDDFPATGLYYNTDPLIPIYLVETPFEGSAFGVVWEHDFIFSKDMQYFAWIPITNGVALFDTTGTTALVFYANGVAQKTYMVSDLVYDADAVSWTTTTAQWIYCRSETMTFNAETNRLTIKTVDGQTYVFDITSGKIVETTHTALNISWLLFTALTAIGLFVLVGGIVFYRAKRRHACSL